uniref:Calmodulin-binding transcription activator 1 n=1 Tax=Graphocephala atropunctata TaxID=36148 RepID=A0A1B6MQW2_9HEMI
MYKGVPKSNTNINNVQSAKNKSHSTQTSTRDNMLSGSEPVLKSGRQSPAHHRPTKHRSHRDSSKLSRFERSMSLPLSSPHSGTDSAYDSDIVHSPPRRMDFALCEMASGPRSDSPIIDVELLSDEDPHANNGTVGEQEVRVLTLAEQIIAAMPDRIKNESEDMMLLLSNQSVEVMESPLLMDEPPSSSSSCCFDTNEFNFDHNYRYYDVSTPSSSLSPASSSCLPSPSPSSFALPDSPSPPPTTADFCEFFHASSNTLFFEKDFSNLTLSDREQRELYEAAKIIQKAYRSYKGRKKLEEQDKERAAAILIQNYYRRYKQYAYFKQMTRAAMVIQNGFRSYCEHKRFKKNQEAAVRIQNYYRNYREQGRAGESTPPTSLKRTYSQRRQHQAARKIQQFMRQSKNKLQRERAERERQVGPCLKDVPQKSSYPDSLLSTEPNNSFRAANDTDSPG